MQIDNNTSSTNSINYKVSVCLSIDELKEEILPLIRSQKEQWMSKIQEILKKSGYNQKAFADLCHVSRQSVSSWVKGTVPKNRETFIRIGLAAGYDSDELDHFLTRYGRYPGLYSKCLNDCVCMFVLKQHRGIYAINRYDYILNRIKGCLTDSDIRPVHILGTSTLDQKIALFKDDAELETFVTENAAVFSDAYRKLYAYIKMHIEANLIDRREDNVGGLVEHEHWSASIKKCISAIYQQKWYPERNKIIALGLHLNMDHDQIDDMLIKAHMEPLCAKNAFESVVMFLLDDAVLNNRLITYLDDYDPNGLINHARDVMEQLNLPEVSAFIKELSGDRFLH